MSYEDPDFQPVSVVKQLLFRVWADRTMELMRKDLIRYVLPFENRGVEVGVTLHHPHGQIYAYSTVPPIPARMQETQAKYYKENGVDLLSYMIENERKVGARILYDGGLAVAFVPACARYPYEVWVAPVRNVAFIAELNADEIASVSRALKTVLMKYDGLWQRPFPYLMALYQAPTDHLEHREFHFHIEFYPPYRSRDRLRYVSGDLQLSCLG